MNAKEATTWTEAVEAICDVLWTEFGDRELDVLVNHPKMIHFAARNDRRHIVTIGVAGIRGERPGKDGEYDFWSQV